MGSLPKVLVTGGTGFVGAWMKRTQPKDVQGIYLSRWDYESERAWPDVDYIAHLANIAPDRVLEWAQACDARLLYASSGAAYERMTEYAYNKRCWERECLDSGVNVVVARLFTFYGEGMNDPSKAIVQFARAARAEAPIRIFGDGNTVRSYMYGEDMGRWLWAILLRGAKGEIYDVGSDQPVTMLQLARWINAKYGNHSKIILEFGQEECRRYLPHNIAKTMELLGTSEPVARRME